MNPVVGKYYYFSHDVPSRGLLAIVFFITHNTFKIAKILDDLPWSKDRTYFYIKSRHSLKEVEEPNDILKDLLKT